jgi:hypothetical protein
VATRINAFVVFFSTNIQADDSNKCFKLQVISLSTCLKHPVAPLHEAKVDDFSGDFALLVLPATASAG